MHYIIVVAVIAIIVIIQFYFFTDTRKKINKFGGIFPDNNVEYKLSKVSTNGISVDHGSETLKTIINSINDYLKNNKSVSDFHLMKDIVDRNCDAKEEEINTQIPIPLYIGLVGTMAGILIGVGFLVFSEDLSALLNVDIPQWFKDSYVNDLELEGSDLDNAIRYAWSTKGSNGVVSLLGGVAVAMISSILGIIFTTWASNKFKSTKSIVENKKHTFLSWIQTKLLPVLSDNVVGAIREMTENLTEFNAIFSENIGNMDVALSKVNESYRQQTQLLEAVQKIVDKDLTLQNVQLYNVLKNSTKEVGIFTEYLQSSNLYLANVKALNEKLDLQESRAHAMEEMVGFFKTELEQIDERKGAISKVVGTVDDYLKQALDKLKENAESQFVELQKSTVKQQDILRQKAEEINVIVEELKHLTAVKDSISKFEQAMVTQNNKLDALINAMLKSRYASADVPIFTERPIFTEPKPVRKNLFIVAGSLVGGLVLLALSIANWDYIYSFINKLRF